MLRLELMKKLKDEGYNSKEISEFLNVNGIRPLRTDNPYSPKLVWVTLNKYEKRLSRVGNTKLISFKETLYVQPNTKGLQFRLSTFFAQKNLISEYKQNLKKLILVGIFNNPSLILIPWSDEGFLDFNIDNFSRWVWCRI